MATNREKWDLALKATKPYLGFGPLWPFIWGLKRLAYNMSNSNYVTDYDYYINKGVGKAKQLASNYVKKQLTNIIKSQINKPKPYYNTTPKLQIYDIKDLSKSDDRWYYRGSKIRNFRRKRFKRRRGNYRIRR